MLSFNDGGARDLNYRPRLLSTITDPFCDAYNFLKGCKWAPDGSCLLTCSEDTALRIFNTPQQFCSTSEFETNNDINGVTIDDIKPSENIKDGATIDGYKSSEISIDVAVCCQEGELVYDYCWFPLMNSHDPVSCCFASTSRDHPIHLYDAFTGQLRATYRAYNSVDEVTAAYCVSFGCQGECLLAGFNGWVAEFDVSSPGRQISKHPLKVSGSDVYQSGIVSCLAFSPTTSGVYAAGTYTKSIGLYSRCAETPLCLLHGHSGGVTQVKFSEDGNRLYSGARQDGEVLCWDLRQLGRILFSVSRSVSSCQRIYFDLTPVSAWTGETSPEQQQQLLLSGGRDGWVRGWQMAQCETGGDGNPVSCIEFLAHADCCNAVSCNPVLPLLATCSGQRHIDATCLNSSSEGEDNAVGEKNGHKPTAEQKPSVPENSVKLWRFPDSSHQQIL